MADPVIIGDCTRIYALCYFPSEEPRYVGKTIRPLRQRLNSHRQVALKKPRLPVGRWLAKCARENTRICIKWLETVDAGADWAAREAHWIAKLRAEGHSLLNLTTGGEGLPGHIFSHEHKAKISASLKRGATHSCLVCDRQFYRKPSAVTSPSATYCSRRCANTRMRSLF